MKSPTVYGRIAPNTKISVDRTTTPAEGFPDNLKLVLRTGESDLVLIAHEPDLIRLRDALITALGPGSAA